MEFFGSGPTLIDLADADQTKQMKYQLACFSAAFTFLCAENIIFRETKILHTPSDWANAGHGTLIKTILFMTSMLLNNVIWVSRRRKTTRSHIIHHLVAALLLILYSPRLSWWPVQLDQKLALTIMNIFIFQALLAYIAGLTATHQFIITGVTAVDSVY